MAIDFRTLRENVVEAIRDKIINQELKPGERIVEMELTEEFKTSRGPVREALRQLEHEGLIEYTRNVGCTVKNPDLQESFEIYLIRVSYEILAVKYMGGRIPPETISNMEKVLEKMKALDESRYAQVYLYDNEFHGELVKMTKLKHLYRLWSELSYGNIVTGYNNVQDKKRVAERQYTVHKDIVDACRTGDAGEICKVVSEHYMRTITRLIKEQGVKEDEVPFSRDFLL